MLASVVTVEVLTWPWLSSILPPKQWDCLQAEPSVIQVFINGENAGSPLQKVVGCTQLVDGSV